MTGAALAVGLLSACGPTVTMPDVVGMRLDDAHRKLEKLGVENFDDSDTVGDDRIIFLDRNWVVVAQEPKAGTREVDTDTEIKLSVGKVSDDDILQHIPADSPVAQELAEKADEEKAKAAKKKAEAERAEAKKKREQAAERLEESRDLADHMAKIARSMNGLLGIYDRLYVFVRENGYDDPDALNDAGQLAGSFSIADSSMAVLPEPDHLDGVKDDLRTASRNFSEAAAHAESAIRHRSAFELDQAARLRREGGKLWERAIRRIFDAADRKPVLPPPAP